MPKFIDVNILKMKLRERFRTQFDFNDVIDADDLKTVIQQMPIADVQEVRHGKWLDVNNIREYTCSECGAEAPNDGYDDGAKYCYNCGARMEGESDE